MSSSNESKLSLKLLINKKTSKVLFAEADKDFVDFLFSILTLPIGTVTSLLNQNDHKCMVGSLETLYNSIKSLSNSYTLSDQSKAAVLNPKLAFSNHLNTVPLLGCKGVVNGNSESNRKIWYMCQSCSSNQVSDQRNSRCSCGCQRTMQVDFVKQSSVTKSGSETKSGDGGGGYVKGLVSYMVLDDLCVEAMSTISSISLLNKFNVGDLSSLEEMNVNLGMSEGLKLLKASLCSKTVLTDVFLH